MEDEPRATSRSSRLLQQATSPTQGASPEATQQLRRVFEVKEKLTNITQVSLLDFKRQSPDKVKSCVEVLLRLQRNILESPAQDKFRKVKESSRVFAANIIPFKAASDFLSTAGWRLKTVDFEPYWLCDAQPGTQEWRVLQEAESVLVDSLQFLEHKSEKYLKEKATLKEKQAAERDHVRNAIIDDKQMRKYNQETRVLLPSTSPRSRGDHTPSKASPSGMMTEQLHRRHENEPEDDDPSYDEEDDAHVDTD